METVTIASPGCGDRDGACRNPRGPSISARNPATRSAVRRGRRETEQRARRIRSCRPPARRPGQAGARARARARARAAHLEVAGLAGVEDPAEEVAQLAEGEEEAVAEERGERGHVREPHHRSPTCLGPSTARAAHGGGRWRIRMPRRRGGICSRESTRWRAGEEGSGGKWKRSLMATRERRAGGGRLY